MNLNKFNNIDRTNQNDHQVEWDNNLMKIGRYVS